MASCSNDDFVGEKGLTDGSNNQQAIAFSTGVPAVTRADATGAEAAGKLHNTFYVYGIKNESADVYQSAENTHNRVFTNYKVVWNNNTAYTTTSNTMNWEYVGQSMTVWEHDQIRDGHEWNNGTHIPQTIKYWDWGASDYTFYAFSADPADLESRRLLVKKDEDDASRTSILNKGYHIEIRNNESINLDELYFAERVFLRKSTDGANTDRNAENKYGGYVTFRFRKLASRVRAAMYETIPGYRVKIDRFKVYNIEEYDGASDGTNTPILYENSFAANYNYHKKDSYGSMEIHYNEDGSLKPSGTGWLTPAYILELGGGINAASAIGTTSAGATYDRTDKAYTTVFSQRPDETNRPMRLKVSYTLQTEGTTKSDDEIKVVDAEVMVPVKLLLWKPGYAYTYIFKISDNTNGHTGGAGTPAGLYPITLDAVVAETEEGEQTTLSAVSTPTITVFGYYQDEYTPGSRTYHSGSDLYVVITDADGNVITPEPGTNVKVYDVRTTNAETNPITEASVAEAIKTPSSALAINDVTDYDPESEGTKYFAATPSVVASVPGVDGNNKTINALKLTGVAARYFAIEYTYTEGTEEKKVYLIIHALDTSGVSEDDDDATP